jgi:hypothetical protein
MNLKHFVDSAKGALFTEEAPEVSHNAPAPTMPTLGPSSVAILSIPLSSYTLPSSASPSDLTNPNLGTNPFVDILKSKVNFDSTPIGKSLKEHLDPLAGLPLSENQQLTAAIKAGIKDGLTANAILSTFSDLIAKLSTEKDKFASYVTNQTKLTVTNLQTQIQTEADKIKDLEAQITASRDRQSQLSTDLLNATTKIQTSQVQFSAAYDSLAADLNNSISHYTSILKG